ncbi:dehydratase family domain-containing protein [Ditylenchus destructor]|uniref:Dehydratase family domain-containing protein n=1 Tax=Ditylenchus destructor TaxID=166010 RepID=A0AAD4MFZ7_9BILA|nr:dehydratase family domain-containing protein [Ditylenchus destructor]
MRSSSIRRSADRPTHRSTLLRSPATSASSAHRCLAEKGHAVPLLVNLQPAGEYLGEDYYRAGGVPAVVSQLIDAGLIHKDAGTVNGKSIGANCRGVPRSKTKR